MNTYFNFKYPKSVSDIITGRSSLDNWLKNNYYEFYEYLINTFTDALSIKERIYMFYNNINKRPVCNSCKKPVKFHGYIKGFGKFCCPKCAQNDKTTRDNYMKSVKEKYGEDAFKVFSKKSENTKLKRYGDKNYNNTEKNKQTCLERYGVDNPMKSKKIREKSKQTCLKRYGVENITQSEHYKSMKNEM